MAVVFADDQIKPVFLTDNRYKLQSKAEIDSTVFDVIDPETATELSSVLIKNLKKDEQVGIDG